MCTSQGLSSPKSYTWAEDIIRAEKETHIAVSLSQVELTEAASNLARQLSNTSLSLWQVLKLTGVGSEEEQDRAKGIKVDCLVVPSICPEGRASGVRCIAESESSPVGVVDTASDAE
ncbi:hypothetical protein SRHO_G00250130 [Serrasalmus rhombeus]